MYFDEAGFRYVVFHTMFEFILPLKLSTIASAVANVASTPAGTSVREVLVRHVPVPVGPTCATQE